MTQKSESVREVEQRRTKWFITCACLEGDCENCPSDALCAHSCHVPDEKIQAERGPAAEYLYRIGDIFFNGDTQSFCWDMTDSQLGEWAVKTLTNYAKSVTLKLAEEAEHQAGTIQNYQEWTWSNVAAWLREKAR